ncbi:MAG: M14 family zinc carboxypeptidase [Acidimicrobiia bacterium]
MRRAELAAALAVASFVAACSSGPVDEPLASDVAPVTSATASTTSSTVTSTSTTTSTSSTVMGTSTTTSTSSTTTSSTSTTVPRPVVADPETAMTYPVDVEVEIGRSVEGRPITVIRRGTPGGTRVLAVGVIHGNEDAGVAIIDRLAVDPVPEGVELWLVRSMNPDGQAIDDRQNANRVDLNRNFPENWDVLGAPGDWQYGGPSPASEPETRAMVALGAALRPDLILWYHQDLYRIAPGSGRPGEIRTRYAEIAGLPIVEITGGTYTGTASQWSRSVIRPDGVGITVELGPTLTPTEIDAHVRAVHTVALDHW